MRHAIRLSLLLACRSSDAAVARESDPQETPPQLLTWSQQIAVREEWLAQRHALLLAMMRRHELDWPAQPELSGLQAVEPEGTHVPQCLKDP